MDESTQSKNIIKYLLKWYTCWNKHMKIHWLESKENSPEFSFIQTIFAVENLVEFMTAEITYNMCNICFETYIYLLIILLNINNKQPLLFLCMLLPQNFKGKTRDLQGFLYLALLRQIFLTQNCHYALNYW